MATSKSEPTIDWSNWSPAKPGEVRSPCPAINALANHNIIPHDGKNISKTTIITALQNAFHLDPLTAKLFSAGAVAANPHHDDPTQHNSFDLDHVDKHGFIEHDSSLSRDDIAFGSNADFSHDRWVKVWEILQKGAEKNENGVLTTNWKSCAEARFARVLESKDRHEKAGKEWDYGLKEAILSYGETALYVNVLGKNGKAPLEWVRIFFEEERIPYKEGWRAPAKVDQLTMNYSFFEMLKAYGHGTQEAQIVGVGTVQALKAAIFSLIKVPSPMSCSVM